MGDERKLLTVMETAVRLTLNTSTVHKMLKDGRLAGVKVGKSWRIPADAMPAPMGEKATSKVEPEVVDSGVPPVSNATVEKPADRVVDDYKIGEVVDVEGIGRVEVSARVRELLYKRAEAALATIVGKLEQDALGFITEQDVADFEKKKANVDARQEELDNLHASQDAVARMQQDLSSAYYRLESWYKGVDERMDTLKELAKDSRKRIDWENNQTQNLGKSMRGVMGFVALWVSIRDALSGLLELPGLPELDYVLDDGEGEDNPELFDTDGEQEPDYADQDAILEKVEQEVDEEVEKELPDVEEPEIVTSGNKRRSKKQDEE